MASKNIFNVKDKVFAKYKGWPAWPAMILSIDDENSLHPKYIVQFYGTYACAECLPEELFSFETHKLEFKNPKKISQFKRIMFIKAFEEIENDFILPMDSTQVSTVHNNIETKPNLGIKKKFNKLNVSTVNKLDAPKKGMHISRKTKEATKHKKIYKKPMVSKENVKDMELKELVVTLNKLPFEAEIEKPQNSKTSSSNVGTDKQNCLPSSSTVGNVQITESCDGINGSNLTAKSVLANKKKITSNSGQPQQDKNSSITILTSPSCPKDEHHKQTVFYKNDRVKPKPFMSKTKMSIDSKNDTGNNETNNSCASYCTNQDNDESDKKIIKPSRLSLRLNIKKSNPKNIVSIEHALNKNVLEKNSTNHEIDFKINEHSKQNLRLNKKQNPTYTKPHTPDNNDSENNSCTNQNEYSGHKTNNDKNILIKENNKDSKSSCAGCIKSVFSSPNKYVKTGGDTSKKSNMPKGNMATLSNQSKMNQLIDKIENDSKSPISSQDVIVDAGSKIRMKKSPSKEDVENSKIDELQNLLCVMDYIYEIRSALCIDNPNYKVVIKSLLQIKEYNLSAFMWKKNPDMVETIMKVSKYTGYTDVLKVSHQKLTEHNQNATKIRSIAQEILQKISSLFNVSNLQTFGIIFRLAVHDFQQRFKSLGLDVIHSATSENELIRLL